MSFPTNNMMIGLIVDETNKLLANIDIEAGTYDLVDEGGDVIPTREGITVIQTLRKNEPEKNFLAIPAH